MKDYTLHCPHCDSKEYKWLPKTKRFVCSNCHREFRNPRKVYNYTHGSRKQHGPRSYKWALRLIPVAAIIGGIIVLFVKFGMSAIITIVVCAILFSIMFGKRRYRRRW